MIYIFIMSCMRCGKNISNWWDMTRFTLLKISTLNHITTKKWQFCVSITIIYIGAYTRSALKHNINLHLHARWIWYIDCLFNLRIYLKTAFIVSQVCNNSYWCNLKMDEPIEARHRARRRFTVSFSSVYSGCWFNPLIQVPRTLVQSLGTNN